MSPIEAVEYVSKIGWKVVPLFVDFQTPPVAKPTWITYGLFSTTAMSSMRPPMLAGPMPRQTKRRNIGSSDQLTGVGVGLGVGVGVGVGLADVAGLCEGVGFCA